MPWSIDLAPFFAAPFAVQLHTAAAIVAFLVGAVQMFGPGFGRLLHICLGILWVSAMAVVVLSSVFIRDLFAVGPSMITIFIPITTVGLVIGLWRLAHRDFRGHGAAMRILYVSAMLIAGGFTFVPGRLMHQLAFG